eukprot:Anaeramoba_ignava/a478206_2950.p1 GENE.a478206_2950~~a478206_2950.p1  ORF type:complete len:831 (-),score=221.74 a478206_2950:143-2635(-)
MNLKLQILIILAVLLSFVVSVPSKLYYVVGHEYVYSLHGTLDARGHDVSAGTVTYGTSSAMDATYATECVDEDDEKYLFVTNMFDTTVSVSQGNNPPQLRNLGDTPLGDDMYYEQYKATGQLGNIWYESDDSMELVKIKLGAINSMQTYLVSPNQHATYLEDDPVGKHDSTVYGYNAADDSLKITKSFTEKNVITFADTALLAKDVKIQATTTTVLETYGHIQTSSVNQLSVFLNNAASKRLRGAEGYNSDIGSQGTLDVVLQIIYGQGEQGKRLKSSNHLNFKTLANSKRHVKSTLFDLTRKHIELEKKSKDFDFDPKELLNEIISLHSQFPSYDGKIVSKSHKLSKYFQRNPEFTHEIMRPILELGNNDYFSTLSLILTKAGTPEAQDLLIQFGLNSVDPEIKNKAIVSTHFIEHPTLDLIQALMRIGKKERNSLALFALGSVLKSTDSEEIRSRGLQIAGKMLSRAISSKKHNKVANLLYSLANAGSFVVPFEMIPITTLATYPDTTVKRAFINLISKFLTHPQHSESAFQILYYLARTESDYTITSHLSKLLHLDATQVQIQGSDFPFNKSYDKELKLGGSTISVTFKGELFAGTNFDCNQQYFNYKAYANAEADIDLFGWGDTAFQAQAEYGRENGIVLSDRIFVTVFGKTIYSKNIPYLDCQEHTYNLAHTSPGFSVSYTLFVSVIPITFYAQATLTLNLDWGWNICDSDLSAMIELIPGAIVTFSGGAEINLFIIKGGVELSGSMNTDIRPQGYIHGSLCTVGFDLRRTSTPFSIQLDAYYAWKECKFLIFDCHWGKHDEYVFWKWSEPTHNDILYQKEWKIA